MVRKPIQKIREVPKRGECDVYVSTRISAGNCKTKQKELLTEMG